MQVSDIKAPLLGFNPESIALSGSDQLKQILDFNPNAHKEYRGHSGAIWSCAITSDNLTIFSGSDDTTVKIWETGTQTCIGTLTDHTKCVSCLSPDKEMIPYLYQVAGTIISTSTTGEGKSE